MSWTRLTGMPKIGRYCAYQERCHSEVRRKLRDLGCPHDEAEEVIVELIQQGYLNEERFVRAFVRGKFRMNDWGRIKIRQALRQKQIGERLMEQVLEEEIDAEEYAEKIEKLARAKLGAGSLEDYKFRQKVYAFLLRKGYESSEINSVLEEMRSE